MREGWEIKKLGEVCEKLTDGSHNPPKGIFHSDYLMLSSQNIHNDKLLFDDVRYLTKENFIQEDKRTSVREGDVLLTIVGTIGRCAIFTGNKNITLQRSVAVLRPQKEIFCRYLMYCVIGKNSTLNEEAHGIAQKGLYLKQLSKILIPIPPLAEQEKIVEELDCLSGVIEKKKQQLKDLDALAQSIFYEMFGNPIENEKGWEVSTIGELCKTTSGGTPSKSHNEYYDKGNIPWLRSGEVCQMYISETELFITELGLQNSSTKWFPIDTVVIAMYGATVGQVGILKKEMTTNQAICGIFPNEYLIPIYLYHFLLSKKQEFIEIASGGAQSNISQNIIRETCVYLPPLSLQQEFASKIEAIEKQKELIKQSIKETETLFNSRMDYYFN